MDKRQCRNLLHDRSRIQRRTLLEAWFACWRHSCHDCPFDALARLTAVAYHQFRKLGVQVSKALRADDVDFYTSLLRDCAEFLRPQDVKHLWRVVRRSLPKFQQRRLSVQLAQLEQLEDQWLPHYAELEAGIPITPGQLVQDCAFEQALRRIDAPLHLRLADLPCLTQLERAFRSCSAGKATGFDPLPSPAPLAALYHDLALKEFVWQCEPMQDKGGPVALIPKTLHPHTAKQFREILLLPSVGKRTHAILRSQIMEKLTAVRAPGQLGGFPGQQVIYGSHAIRTFGALCDNAGLSCAVLFLDLASAFHHLIRESVVGAWDGSHLEPVLAVLQQSGHAASNFQCFARLPGLLSKIGIAEPIVRLLRDIHIGTWCRIHARWLLRTHRGTRPGSPLADIIFHALMVRVAQSIDEWIGLQDDFVSLMHELDVAVPTILWADDIAVALATRKAADLVPFLQEALQHVRHTLRDYGFTLNFSKGKTSAVMTLKGARSGELRKQYQLHANPGVTAPLKMGKLMHFVPTYQHLGTLLHLTMHYIVNCDLGLVWPSRHLPNWLSQFWPTSLCLANYGCNFSNLLLLPSCILVSGLGQHQPRNKSNTCKGHWLQCLRECCVLVRSVSRLIGFWCLQILRRIELDLQWKGYYMRRDYSVRVRPFYTICYRLNLPKLNTLGCMGCELTLHGWKKPAPNVYLAR